MLRTALAALAVPLFGILAPFASAQERASAAWHFTLENDKWGDGDTWKLLIESPRFSTKPVDKRGPK
mgnify:CR=1 FL=1